MTPSKPPITSTVHILPFERLSPLDFERLCLWLVEREGYTRVEHLGLAGSEQGRDVVAYKATSQGDKLWYFQCKRYRSINAKTLKDEVDKYLRLVQEKPHLKPSGVVFVVSCAVSADAREEVGVYCEQHDLAYEIWALTELDLRAKRHPDLLREFFDLYSRPIRVPFQAPPLPPHFIPRSEVSDTLKAQLLADETAAPGVLVVSAIHGLGGIGKSVLAAALAHDPEVQERFSDGVLWATLGQQPELLSLLSSWVQVLGAHDFHPAPVEAASAHLRTLLYDKAALLVVDDVWDPAHVLPFQVGGPRCQVLITTRRADVADEVGADLYQLDVMTPGQSLDLLSARSGRTLGETEREDALRLAEAVGYLPLALELTAVRVSRGTPWAALREALEQEIARLEALEGPRCLRTVRPRLEASLNLSLDALRTEDEAAWQAFVWLGVLPEDVLVAAPMAAMLWEMDQAEASEMLELLWNDALLLPGPPVLVEERHWPAFRPHDLLHDIARRLLTTELPQGLGVTLQQAHARLLDRYRARTQEGLWHTLPDDGYIHAHLAWHMERADREDELHTLLRGETAEGRNAWYEARERLGQTAGYLEDVARAWQLAEERFANRDLQFAIGLQCRYALISVSINSLVRNIPPALVVALVERGIWTPDQGLAYACRVPYRRQRAETLAGLAFSLVELGYPQEVVIAVQEKDLEGAGNALGSEVMFKLVITMAELGYLQEALATVCKIDAKGVRTDALIQLAPYLSGLLLEEAMTIAQELPAEMPWYEGSPKAKALVELATRFSEPQRGSVLQEAVRTTRELSIAGERAKMLAKLASRFTEPERSTIWQEALAAAQEIEDKQRVKVLIELVAYVPESLGERVLRETLVMAREVNEPRDRARILAGLAPSFSELERDGVWQEALAAAREIGKAGDQARALADLASYSSEPERSSISREALAVVRRIDGDWQHRARILTELVVRMPKPLKQETLREALAAAREISEAGDQAWALADLASHFSEPERSNISREALVVVRRIEDDEDRAWLLTKLGAQMPEPLREEALRDVLAVAWGLPESVRSSVSPPGPRSEVLAAVAPCLPETLLKDALAIVRQIEGKEEQVWILKRLTPHLSEPLVREALAVVREVNGFYRYYMEDALVKLVSRLAELGYSEEALTLVQEMTCDERRAEALAGLAPHLPQTLLVTALAVALELPTSGGGYGVDLRGRALDGLSPYLPASLLQEALMTTREILDQDNRAEVLAGLCQHLPDLFLQESLAAARAIGRIDRRAKVLAELATNLSGAERENVLQEALVAVQEIKNARTFAEVLIELSPRMPQMPFSEVLMTVVDAGTRLDFEQRLEDLALAASQLTDSRLREMLAATQKIKLPEYRMWTLAKLVSYLPETEREEALRETLAVARMVRDSSDKRLLLLELVPKLAALGYPKDALQEALLIEDEELRAEVLAELAPYLPMRLLRDALMVAWETERKWARATVLAGLAPHLSEPEKEAIWQEVSKVLEAEARDDRRLWKRWRGLGMLVAYLPESLLQEVLKEALEIEDWDSRMAVLTRLAPRMAELGYPQQTTKVAREIRLEHFQKPVLIDLAALLAELSYFQEALDVTRQIQYPDHQAKAIIGIASYLPDPLLQEALLEARSIWEKTDRAIALIGLSPCLVGLSCETLFSLWCETLAFLSRRTREDLLADLLALAPVIAALGGMEAIAETFRAIQDVGRWWP